MALQLGALRDALAEAGASPEAAARASEELAGYETRFTDLSREMAPGFAQTDRKISEFARSVDTRFVELAREVDTRFAAADVRFAKIEGEMLTMKWMLGFVLAILVPMAFRLFTH